MTRSCASQLAGSGLGDPLFSLSRGPARPRFSRVWIQFSPFVARTLGAERRLNNHTVRIIGSRESRDPARHPANGDRLLPERFAGFVRVVIKDAVLLVLFLEKAVPLDPVAVLAVPDQKARLGF